MFTGLVEEVGSLAERQSAQGGGARLKVSARRVLEGIALGDSIAVNGVCLTAVEWNLQAGWVLFDAVAETLRLTTLNSLSPGSPLNLERALAVGDRVGGHYVTGHIDGSGSLGSRETSGNGVVHRFACPAELLSMIAAKGSITIDGISLTVVEVDAKGFSVWIVPHTLTATNLGSLALGSKVNLETDILAKYVNKALRGEERGQTPTVTLQQLKEAGF